MKRKPEVTVNLVRPYDSETYEIVSDYDMNVLRTKYRVVPEKARFDEKTNMHGRFYIKTRR